MNFDSPWCLIEGRRTVGDEIPGRMKTSKNPELREGDKESQTSNTTHRRNETKQRNVKA